MWSGLRALGLRREGNVTMIVAGGLAMLTGSAVLGIDTATIFLEKRRLQGVADAAALAAAADVDNAEAGARAAVALAPVNATQVTTVTRGRFSPDPAVAVDQRFTANAPSPNAAHVALESRVDPIFARIWGRQATAISARATAARIDLAAFSIGSRLASVQGGLPNALLSQLAGSELNLSVMDYNALVSGQVDLLRTAELLRTEVGLHAVTFGDVLATDIALPRLVTAMAGATTNGAAATALRSLAARLPNQTVRLDRIIDLGPLADNIRSDAKRPVQVDAFALLREALQLSSGTRQVRADIDLLIPGIASSRLYVATGERPANSRWVSIGSAGQTVVRTAQTRIWIDITLAQVPLGIGSIRVPLYIELAEAQAQLAAVGCRGGRTNASAALDVTPSVGRTAIADLDPALLGDFQRATVLRLARVATLPLASVTAAADIALGGTQAQRVAFTAADIDGNVVKSVATNDIARGVASGLLRSVDIRAQVLGLGLSAGLLTSTVGNVLSAAAPALDLVVSQVTALVGVRVGEADVRIDGVRCGMPMLVA